MSAAAGTLDALRLRELLAGEPFVADLRILERTASTNDEALRLAAQGAPEGTVVLADAQSAGRGRLGRAWHSVPGAGVYLSALLRPAAPLEHWTRWTIASALAVCEACRGASGCEVLIEWPNDLTLEGRKTAGILCEVRSTPAPVLVVGIGINVNHGEGDFPPDLRQRAISLRMARSGLSVERERVAADTLRALGQISAALARGAWDQVRKAWTRRAPLASNGRVRVLQAGAAGQGPCFEGITRGLDDVGALLVERSDSAVVTVHAAGSVEFLEA